jgi:hypothetical protein
VADDLPCTCLVEAVLLVPNEFLLVVETRLMLFPFDEDEPDVPAITPLPDVSRRDPLYTSLPWYFPPDG